MVAWITMGSKLQFAGQKRGAEHYTVEIRYAFSQVVIE